MSDRRASARLSHRSRGARARARRAGHRDGGGAQRRRARAHRGDRASPGRDGARSAASMSPRKTVADIEATQREVRRILSGDRLPRPARRQRCWPSSMRSRCIPSPVPCCSATVLFLMFQAVFSWATVPMDLIKNGVAGSASWLATHMAPGPLQQPAHRRRDRRRGSVLVFLPQILILFFFILVLEDSGYLPRAAFLLDRLMGKVGLSGRAFIPLLSSFACAIPGIMAARTIPSARDRLATIMIAPLMTCSARLPVYALLIAAFIPASGVGLFNLQGLVLFALYLAGVLAAMARGIRPQAHRDAQRAALADARAAGVSLAEPAQPAARTVGACAHLPRARRARIILSLMIVLWFLASFPAPPAGATGPAIQYSFAGHARPRAARSSSRRSASTGRSRSRWCRASRRAKWRWARSARCMRCPHRMPTSARRSRRSSLPPGAIATGLSLLAWYVFAPQCLSTLAVVKRETNSWRYPLHHGGVSVRARLSRLVRHLPHGPRARGRLRWPGSNG